MEAERLWTELQQLARQLGVTVRLENLETGEDLRAQGGLCRLGPRLVAFVDRRLAPAGRCRQLGAALGRLDLEGVYLRPAVRSYLQGLGAIPRDED